MNVISDPGRSLDFLADPAMIVERDGKIVGANAPARRLIDSQLAGSNISMWAADPPEEIDDFLRRASRSTSPTVGAIRLKGAAGTETFRVLGARVAAPSGAAEPRLVLHCRAVGDDQFAMLTRRVRELDDQLRRGLQEKAALEETVRQNQTLLRELQHRVKNNVQLMVSLIGMSAKGRQTPEVDALVETAELRLQAIANAQEAIYLAANATKLPARDLLCDLVRTVATSYGVSDAVTTEIEEGWLASDDAHCVALIVNELLTNALKYGLRDGDGRIVVRFVAADDGYCLSVADNGPGIPETLSGGVSGLRLVRSLCRQIGGRLEVNSEGGTTCSVYFDSYLG